MRHLGRYASQYTKQQSLQHGSLWWWPYPPTHLPTPLLCFYWTLSAFFSSLILHTVDRTPWTGISPSQYLYLHTEQHKKRINAHRHLCHWVGFEPTIPVFEWAKTVHVLDRAATVIGVRLKHVRHILSKKKTVSKFHVKLERKYYYFITSTNQAYTYVRIGTCAWGPKYGEGGLAVNKMACLGPETSETEYASICVTLKPDQVEGKQAETS
jgi:hypothetical protein